MLHETTRTPIVPVGDENPSVRMKTPRVLARLSTYPGVTAYWMGRSYLGQNLWAADVMLPSPAVLHSRAKESTLKAVVVYSGRQHANEVSSTSHILKLGEQLVADPETRAMLKQVNVVLHPITNTDGAQLSMDLAGITPDNILHPGYHGALAADVANGQGEIDPVYPESRTRRQLIRRMAAGCVSESARIPVARMGAAFFRILPVGCKRVMTRPIPAAPGGVHGAGSPV